jgi:hypothetical protein
MKKAPTPRVLVVGLGNPDRGDDGVGPIAVEKLVGLLPTDVAVAPHGADVLTLMMEGADFDAVIFVDAAAPLTTPGRIHCFNPAKPSYSSIGAQRRATPWASPRRSDFPGCYAKPRGTLSSLRSKAHPSPPVRRWRRKSPRRRLKSPTVS